MESKSDILFVNFPPWDFHHPPLAITYLENYSRKKGLNTKVLDLNIDFYANCKSEDKTMWEIEEFVHWFDPGLFNKQMSRFPGIFEQSTNRILKEKTKLICIFSHAGNLNFIRETLKKVRLKSKTPIVVGGPGVVHKSLIKRIEDLVDFIILGK